APRGPPWQLSSSVRRTQTTMAASVQTCIYCRRLADSRDHAPPKLLLSKPYPPNMVTVPSCKSCNQEASLDEEYFRVLLAHLGTSPELIGLIEPGGAVDRALSRSTKLADRLDRSLGVSDDGHPFIRPEIERIH